MSHYEFEDGEPRIIVEKHSSGIGTLILGMAIGAGVALLFAPRSGAATRRVVRDRALRARQAAEDAVSGVRDGVTDTFHDARRRVEERLDSARQAIDLKKEQVHRAMDAGRAAAKEAREDLEVRLTETRAAYGAAGAPAPQGRPGRPGRTDGRGTDTAAELDEE